MAKSSLKRMGYIKRKYSNAGKLSLAQFEEFKDEFWADVKVEALINDIPKELIFNWDQTGIQVVPTGQLDNASSKGKACPDCKLRLQTTDHCSPCCYNDW